VKSAPLPLFISAAALTETYGIPASTVRSWIYRRRSDGRPVSPVPFSRVGRGAVLFSRVDLETYIERKRVGGVPTLRRAAR